MCDALLTRLFESTLAAQSQPPSMEDLVISAEGDDVREKRDINTATSLKGTLQWWAETVGIIINNAKVLAT